MKFIIILLILLVLVGLDKGLTAATIIQHGKHHPELNRYDVEKNHAARYFFEKTGLLWGSLIYLLISLITLVLVFYLFSYMFNQNISLYILGIIYSIVIFNNVYWLLKFSEII